jgi:hypothetical protein
LATIENIIKEGSKVQIKSPLLNIDDIANYDLFISPFEFGFSVINPLQKQCLRLESLVFKEKYESGINDQMILDIFQDNHLLPAAFWRTINIYVSNRCFVLIPSLFFSKQTAIEHLSFNTAFNIETHFWGSHTKGETTLVYGYKKELAQLFKKIYPNRPVQFNSNLANLIEDSNTIPNIVYLFQDNEMITITAYKNSKLEYCNTFYYKNSDDATYYTLLIYRELNFNPEEIQLIVNGSIDTQSILQARLLKYIKNVHLGDRPKGIKFCYNFDELAENRFYNLLNIHHE